MYPLSLGLPGHLAAYLFMGQILRLASGFPHGVLGQSIPQVNGSLSQLTLNWTLLHLSSVGLPGRPAASLFMGRSSGQVVFRGVSWVRADH